MIALCRSVWSNSCLPAHEGTAEVKSAITVPEPQTHKATRQPIPWVPQVQLGPRQARGDGASWAPFPRAPQAPEGKRDVPEAGLSPCTLSSREPHAVPLSSPFSAAAPRPAALLCARRSCRVYSRLQPALHNCCAAGYLHTRCLGFINSGGGRWWLVPRSWPRAAPLPAVSLRPAAAKAFPASRERRRLLRSTGGG